MKLKFIDNAGAEFHRLLSVQVSLWFGVFTGVASVIGAFAGTLNPWFLVAVAVVVNVALIPLARLVKQADAPVPLTPPAPSGAA